MITHTKVSKIFALPLLAAIAFTAGCVGNNYENDPSFQLVNFASVPRSAEVFVDGRRVGTTPCNAVLRRTFDHRINFSLPGYYEEEIVLVPQNDKRFNYKTFPENMQVKLIVCKSGTGASEHSRTAPFIPNATPSKDQQDSKGSTYSASKQNGVIINDDSGEDLGNIPTPKNYTSLRLQERKIEDAYKRGTITKVERDKYVEKLFNDYNATRPMKVKPHTF